MNFNEEISDLNPVHLLEVIKELKTELTRYKLISSSYQKYFNFFTQINEIIVSKKSEVLDVIKDIQSFNDLKQKKNMNGIDLNETNTESNEQNSNESQERVKFTQNANNSQNIGINIRNRISEEEDEESQTMNESVGFEYFTNTLNISHNSEGIPNEPIVKNEIQSEDNTEEVCNEFQIPIDNIRRLSSYSVSNRLEDSSDETLIEHIMSSKITNQQNNESLKQLFKCKECHKVFPNNNKLKRHQMIHTNERPFKCDKCVKQFSRSDNLKAHQLIHTNKQQVVCDWSECGKRFNTNANLNQHKRFVHLNERQFECDYKDCGKTFKDNYKLIRHKRIHSGEQPFVCNHNNCGKRFTDKAHLNRHIKTVHLKQK